MERFFRFVVYVMFRISLSVSRVYLLGQFRFKYLNPLRSYFVWMFIYRLPLGREVLLLKTGGDMVTAEVGLEWSLALLGIGIGFAGPVLTD